MSYLSQNQNYLVSVSRGTPSTTGLTGGTSVVANANAKLRIQIENRWVNVLEALGVSTDGGGGIVGSALAGAQLISGSNFLPVIATSHVWRGSSGIELTLDMRFDAWDDPIADVLNPVQSLIAMFSPTRGAGNNAVANGANFLASGLFGLAGISGQGSNFLAPPGPTPYSYSQSGKQDPMLITVQLGRVMTIDTLIPTTIAWEFENRFAASGDPVCALVTATFISYVVPSLDDILGFFQTRAGGQLGSFNPASLTSSVNSNVAVPSANISTTGAVGGLGGL